MLPEHLKSLKQIPSGKFLAMVIQCTSIITCGRSALTIVWWESTFEAYTIIRAHCTEKPHLRVLHLYVFIVTSKSSFVPSVSFAVVRHSFCASCTDIRAKHFAFPCFTHLPLDSGYVSLFRLAAIRWRGILLVLS